ncbi:MAG: S9 family peptidase [Pseudomonadota bacterium]
MTKPPPKSDRRPHSVEYHGENLSDPYAWLRADNWQEVMRAPDVLATDIRGYLEAENEYAKEKLAPTENLQERLFEEIKARLKEDDATVPAPDGPFAYYQRYAVGGQHPIFCRQKTDAPDPTEHVLLDGDEEAKGHSFFKIATCRHSPDHALLGYAVDLNGSEIYTIRIRDLASGGDLPDALPEANGGFVWANDGKSLFYTVLDENHRPVRVRRHLLGSDPADDQTVYEESDPGFFVGVGKTKSGRFIVISAHDHETSEAHIVDADRPGEAPRCIAPREPKVEYEIEHNGDRFIILTNADGAEDFKIVEAPLSDFGRDKWRDLVPHRPGSLIVGHDVFQDYLVRLERVKALPRIIVMTLADDRSEAISFDEEAYSLGLAGGFEYATDTLRFVYSSMTTPERTFDYDMKTGDRVLRKEQEVPSGHDPSDYVTRRILAAGHDGTEIPVSLLYRKDTAIDGDAPVLLYGYGSYGITIPASFSPGRLSLVDRGFIYAIAHIRGGMAGGYRWYVDGKTVKKKNTFLDYIAAAEALCRDGYARAGNFAAHGGSAGGMLVGAVANMRPDLFKAIVADVPFVDVLTTMLDDTLPLTPPEWAEWGNPITDPQAFRYIRSYSPYDNVEAKDYPSMLVTAGLTDPRVTYWEPAKWVAKLRAIKTDENLLLLRTNMEAGHQGAAGRFDRLKETARAYAFLLHVFGIDGDAAP